MLFIFNVVFIHKPFTIAALAYAGSLVKPGVSGDEVDRKVHEFIISQGCYPSPLGYYSCFFFCISLDYYLKKLFLIN